MATPHAQNDPSPFHSLFDRKALTDTIILRLGIMEGVLKWHTGRGHNDNAKVAEDVVARFLAALCGWSLVNLNTIRPNYPAADLGDPSRRLAIQVTVNGTGEKVGETHEKALKHKLSADFDTLIILFLLEKAPGDPTKSATFTRCTAPKIEKWARPEINARLEKQDNESDDAHLDRLRRCLSVMEKEMSAITHILSAPIHYTKQNLPYASLGHLFVGRADSLLAIRESLTSGHATALKGHALHGMGGVGKTRAAVEYAWQFLASYTHIFMVNADKTGDLDESLARLCGMLELPERTQTDQNVQRDAVLDWFASHPDWLLIIDNADSTASLAAVKRILPKLTTGQVLLTTRLTDVPVQFKSLPLDVLSPQASLDYLLENTRDQRTIEQDDTAQASKLADLLGHLALALEQAAACIRVTRRSIPDYITHWQSHTAEALGWYDDAKMDYPRSLAVTWQSSVDQLSDEAVFLLRQLSWFAPDPIPISILESEHAPANARLLLAELENLSLAKRREDGTAFTVHRLVQEITRQQQPSLPSAALVAALKWVNALVHVDTNDVRTWSIVEPLAPHATAISLNAADRQIPEPTSRLLNQVALFYLTKAQNQTAEPLIDRALSIVETSFGENHPNVATVLNNMAGLLQATNRLAEAEPLMRRALAIDEASFGENHPNVAIRLNNLAALFQDTNRRAEAEPLMRRTLAINEGSFGERHPKVATSLNNLAGLLQDTNRLAEAEPLMRRALAIDEASNGANHPRVATLLNNLAQLLQATNRLAEAEPLVRRALAINEASVGETGHPHPLLQAAANNYGGLLMEMGDTQEQAEAKVRKLLGK